MVPFKKITSTAIPLDLNDVDTDLLIPAQYLTSVSRAGYGENLFRRLRESDPQFPLNLDKYRGAQILISGSNFGCGSSREHAVWALLGWGIRVVIASSFADIFSGNSAKNGLLLVNLDEPTVRELRIRATDEELVLTVDLEQQCLNVTNEPSIPFNYDPFRKHCLLNGLEDLDYILSREEQIERYRATHASNRFFSTTKRSAV